LAAPATCPKVQRFANLEAQGVPDSFTVMGSSMPSGFTDPDLQEVIWPGVTGIPEFDLFYIIPSKKPSQTLQYFPPREVPNSK
jgi:hypothetical protein